MAGLSSVYRWESLPVRGFDLSPLRCERVESVSVLGFGLLSGFESFVGFGFDLDLGKASASDPGSAAGVSASVWGFTLLSASEAFAFLGVALGYGYVLASAVEAFADERVARGMIELLR